MLAVIKTGGKQYVVSPGTTIEVEKLEAQEGKEIVFTDVLLCDNEGKTEIGTPFLKDVKVTGKVLAQTKGDKVVTFKYKSKKRYKRKVGHRQQLTQVEIVSIT